MQSRLLFHKNLRRTNLFQSQKTLAQTKTALVRKKVAADKTLPLFFQTERSAFFGRIRKERP
nr:MAG TPA: hypothetical protein [Caudoviricetes sp.]